MSPRLRAVAGFKRRPIKKVPIQKLKVSAPSN